MTKFQKKTAAKHYFQLYQEYNIKYPNIVILYELGGFYEMFGVDTETEKIGNLTKVAKDLGIVVTRGSKKIEICKAKHDLISSHAARRTFVTLALEKGIRAEIVMAMTGHKSYRTFKKYIKVTDNIMKVEMNRLWNENKLVAV